MVAYCNAPSDECLAAWGLEAFGDGQTKRRGVGSGCKVNGIHRVVRVSLDELSTFLCKAPSPGIRDMPSEPLPKLQG